MVLVGVLLENKNKICSRIDDWKREEEEIHTFDFGVRSHFVNSNKDQFHYKLKQLNLKVLLEIRHNMYLFPKTKGLCNKPEKQENYVEIK